MHRPSFGQREVKEFTPRQTRPIKAHHAYTQNNKPVPMLDRVMIWFSYFVMVFAAIITFQPDTAVAAVLTASDLVGMPIG
jgi:hypothetical protein